MSTREALESRLQHIRMQKRRLVENSRQWVDVDAASRRLDALWVEEARIKALIAALPPLPVEEKRMVLA